MIIKRNRRNAMGSSSNRAENGVDRISSLPDHVLDHVFTFLPTTESVKALVLRPFRHLWASSLKTLIFDSRDDRFSGDHANRRFTEFVSQVVNRHRRCEIERFELKFRSVLFISPADGVQIADPWSFLTHGTAETVDSWIRFAVGKNVKVLDIGIEEEANRHIFRFEYEFPKFAMCCDSLEELHLSNVGLGRLGELISISLENIKTISLDSVRLRVSVIDIILDGCPKLESFELIRCTGIDEMKEISSRSLKVLTVNLGGIRVKKPVMVSGENLVSVNLAGQVGSFAIEKVSMLSDASLKTWNRRTKIERICADLTLVEGLQKITALTLSGCLLETICVFNPPNFACPSYKSLVLKNVLVERHMPAIIWWLRNTTELEHLSIYNDGDTDAMFFRDRACKFVDPLHCLEFHLKTIKLFGRMTSPLIELLTYVLRTSNMLEEVIIATKRESKPYQAKQPMPRELRRLSRNLSKLPKASKNMAFQFRW